MRGVAVDSMPLEGAYDLTASDLRRGKTVPIVVGILSNLLVALPLNGVDACGNALPSWSRRFWRGVDLVKVRIVHCESDVHVIPPYRLFGTISATKPTAQT